MEAEELSTFFLQETVQWVLMLRMPLAKEQMRQTCLFGILLSAL